MARRAEFSAQALLVLAALCAEPRGWRHGYGIARDTGLKSGTLYPILIRLADRGLVEARWEEGRPAAAPAPVPADPGGLASAGAALADTPAPVGAGTRRRDGRRVAVRGVRWAD